MIDLILQEVGSGLPDTREAVRIAVRLLVAMLLGALIGIQREHTGKPAGLRTHILVALGAAVLTIAPQELGMSDEATSRVMQGLITGIGFLGAGAILKLHDTREIEGLTTAAGIWMTAAVGMVAGLGRLGLAALSVLLALFTLSLLARLETRATRRKQTSLVHRPEGHPPE
jgi:putative Mg2+ transporter-C (MgtC) family protein